MELKEVFEPVLGFVKNFQKKDKEPASKQAAKDRLKLVLMQDRASVSPDFFDMMKKELIDVIKKYIEIDEESLEVELTRGMEVGLEGPALYANIPIKNVKPVAPHGDEEDNEPDLEEITEAKVDAAAEDILNQIEEIARKNKEELATVSGESVSKDLTTSTSNDTSNGQDVVETLIGAQSESKNEVESRKNIEKTSRKKSSYQRSHTSQKKAEG